MFWRLPRRRLQMKPGKAGCCWGLWPLVSQGFVRSPISGLSVNLLQWLRGSSE